MSRGLEDLINYPQLVRTWLSQNKENKTKEIWRELMWLQLTVLKAEKKNKHSEESLNKPEINAGWSLSQTFLCPLLQP